MVFHMVGIPYGSGSLNPLFLVFGYFNYGLVSYTFLGSTLSNRTKSEPISGIQSDSWFSFYFLLGLLLFWFWYGGYIPILEHLAFLICFLVLSISPYIYKPKGLTKLD